jgi:hypothetical protein
MATFSDWLSTLVYEEPLNPQTSVKINFWIGVALAVSGGLSLTLVKSSDQAMPVGFTSAGVAVGLMLVSALPVSRTRPEALGRLLAAQGVVLCLLVVAYCWFMWFVTYRVSAGHRPNHVRHAPGVLALAAGYGIRLAYDFGARTRVERTARRLGFIGLVVGGTGDLLVLYFMMSSFGKLFRADPL